jgi:Ser/Thr protein kinase RdoA (MazF antagonist)
MENQFLTELRECLEKNYGLKDTHDFSMVQDTDYNSVISFMSQDKKMIVRVGKIISLEEVREEALALDYLAGKMIPVPKIIGDLNGNLVFSPGFSKTLAVFEFIEGRHVEAGVSINPTTAEAHNAAKVLAKIHKATQDDGKLGRTRHFVGSEIERALADREIIIDKYTGGEEFINELILATQRAKTYTGDFGLVHGDYRSKNLIFDPQGDEIKAVIDFEWYFFGPVLYDLGLMLVEWSCPDRQESLNKEMLEAVLSGYSEELGKEISLDEEIKFWMYYSALSDATTFLLRKAKNFSSSEKIKIGSFMYQKALMARDL